MAVSPQTASLVQQCTKVKQVIEDSMKWVSANVEKDKRAVTLYNLKKLRREAKRYENSLPRRPSVAILIPLRRIEEDLNCSSLLWMIIALLLPMERVRSENLIWFPTLQRLLRRHRFL